MVKWRMKELQKFKERGVYAHVPLEDAMQDPEGKFVKTRWVQSVKCDEVRCRLVAQENSPRVVLSKVFSPTDHLFSWEDCG